MSIIEPPAGPSRSVDPISCLATGSLLLHWSLSLLQQPQSGTQRRVVRVVLHGAGPIRRTNTKEAERIVKTAYGAGGAYLTVACGGYDVATAPRDYALLVRQKSDNYENEPLGRSSGLIFDLK
jgi:hypothetical protein